MPSSSFFNVIVFVGKIESSNLLTFLNLVIVEKQEFILYEYMACDGRGVRSKAVMYT